MAISTLTELKTAITNWAKRDDLSSYLDDLILMGEKWIFRHARTRDMEEPLSVTISSGVAALPADFVALKHAYIDGTPIEPLQAKASSWIYTRYPTRSSESKPKYIAVEGSNFIFGPYPDSAYTVAGEYYKRLTSVISSANALFTANPDLYLFAALSELEAFKKDDKRVELWMAKRNAILADVNNEDRAAEFSGGPLTMYVA